MLYDPVSARDCHSGAEIRATYKEARQRLNAARLAPVPAPTPEPMPIKRAPVPAVPVFITPAPALFPKCRGGDVIAAVILVTGVCARDFHSNCRMHAYAEARQLACWFMRHYSALSLEQIAGKIGRDHSTVHHSIGCVASDLDRFEKRIKDIAAVLHLELRKKFPTP